MYRKVKIFSGKNSKILANKICEKFDGEPINKMKLTRFSDNEFITDIQETVRGCDVFVVQSTQSSAESILENLMIADALKRASASNIIGVFGYLPYSRQDKKCNPREPIGSRLLADILQVSGYNRIITIDLHAEQIQGFFNIPVINLSANYIFIPYIRKLNLSNIIFASPDVGGTKRTRSYSDVFDTDMVICHKHRPNPNEIGEMKLIGDVREKNVILIDDIVDTAGTICKAADLMMENGAISVRGIATHPVLSGNAYDNIEKSKLIELITSDTIQLKQQSSKITVLSVDEMLAKTIKNINHNNSVSSDFEIRNKS